MPSTAPQPKSRRFAVTLNLFVPGAGQWYLGQTALGAIYAVGFLGCFGAMLGLFIRAYARYIEASTSDQLLESVDLDEIARSFHSPWLIGLFVVALVIYVASLVTLRPQPPSGERVS